MKIVKRIELSNGMNLSVLELDRIIIRKKTFNGRFVSFDSRFVTGLEIDGKLYLREEKQYRTSLEDCTWDVLDMLSYYNNNVDLTKFYPEPYLLQKPFNFSELKKELKTRFQNWLSKDTLLN